MNLFAGANTGHFDRELAIPDEDRVELSPETISKTGGFLDRQPDFFVDATGRARLFARLLKTLAGLEDDGLGEARAGLESLEAVRAQVESRALAEDLLRERPADRG